MNDRISQLQKIIDKPLIIKHKENLLYLTGCSFIHGYLLIFPDVKKKAVFFGDGLEKVEGLVSGGYLSNVGKYLKGHSSVLLEHYFTLYDVELLKRFVPKLKTNVAIRLVEQVRLVKDVYEIEAVRAAMNLTANVFDLVRKELTKKSYTEIELAKFILMSGLKLGAEAVSFDPIVAAGVHSAVPHHVPTDSVIKAGEPVVLDFGFKLNNYCSDFTRTVFLKKASREMTDIYESVELAYLKSVNAAKSGMTGEELDAVARAELKKDKLEKYFIHSLGHGTGLEVHELPWVSENSKTVLSDGMIFSIEPGVYVPKKGGVRIEDLVYLEGGVCERFVEVGTEIGENIIR